MSIGIKDVARIANVSPATVSRVLAGKPVNDEMRKRVEAAVAQSGYRPNLSARRLRSQHSSTIGLIVADIRNPFFTTLSRTVEEIAYAEGLRVIFCNTDENREKEKMYLRLLEEERVTGAIIAPTREGVEQVGSTRQPFPIVLIDRAAMSHLHDAVILDNRGAACALVDHLHQRGFRRIAGLFDLGITGNERLEGYRGAIHRLGLEPLVGVVDHAGGNADHALASLMALPQRPDAVIATNGMVLMALVRAAIAARLGIPRDLCIAGFDNDPWTEFVAGGIPVIEQPVDEIGRVAMRMLLQRLRHPDAPAGTMMLSGRLIARGSEMAAQPLLS